MPIKGTTTTQTALHPSSNWIAHRLKEMAIPGEDLADEAIVWISADGYEYTLSEMETPHLVYIIRLVVNRWAETIGVPEIERHFASPNYEPRCLAFDELPAGFFLVRTRIFVLEIFRRFDAGQQLREREAKIWNEVISKIEECLVQENRLRIEGSHEVDDQYEEYCIYADKDWR